MLFTKALQLKVSRIPGPAATACFKVVTITWLKYFCLAVWSSCMVTIVKATILVGI